MDGRRIQCKHLGPGTPLAFAYTGSLFSFILSAIMENLQAAGYRLLRFSLLCFVQQQSFYISSHWGRWQLADSLDGLHILTTCRAISLFAPRQTRIGYARGPGPCWPLFITAKANMQMFVGGALSVLQGASRAAFQVISSASRVE